VRKREWLGSIFLDAPLTHSLFEISMQSMVRMLSGSLRPALIAQKLTTTFFTGKNYIEASIDTGSSCAVSMAAKTMVRTFSSIVANIAWLIEGRDEGELPERVLGAAFASKVDVKAVATRLERRLNLESTTSSPIRSP